MQPGSAFKNYFWTAQLIAGCATAVKMFEPSLEGIAASIAGFLFVMPIAALFAWLRVAVNRARARRLAARSEHRE
jgi:hypothetical protein